MKALKKICRNTVLAVLAVTLFQSCEKDPVPPVVITGDVIGITLSDAVAEGNVTDDGRGSILSRGICWNTQGDPTIFDNQTVETGDTGTFISKLTNLSPGTLYFIRAYATNQAGTAYGEQVSFETKSTNKPTLQTTKVTGLTKNSALSGGLITSDGGEPVTARGVCWSVLPHPTVEDNRTSNGNGSGEYSSYLSGLEPGKTYYVRAYASNITGTGYGNELTFTTQTDPCYSGLPSPVIVFQGSEDYFGSDGNLYTRYELDVENYRSFPDGLFEKAPDLPACGLNTNSSRTWVRIYDDNNRYLYGFCALGASSDLNGIWFGLPKGENPPSGVYIELIDRRCEVSYISNVVKIPSKDCFPDLPSPVIAFEGKSDYTSANGTLCTQYELDVLNYYSFPDILFEKAPDLPACGLNTNSARTWVHIYDNNNRYLYGFCALGESKDMNQIWFGLQKSLTPPAGVYIEIIDRKCGITYRSNTISLN